MFTEGVRPQVIKEDITLPSGYEGKLAFLLHNVLTEEECKNFIQETEQLGYIPALVNVGRGREKMMPDVRNSKRCIIDSVPYVEELWARIKEFIPPVFKKRRVLGLNERLRFLRYDPGDYFKLHFDGSYVRYNGERSAITFQLYLNEGFEGGATTFIGVCHDLVPVIPKTGSVLVFQHDICHEGSELIAGCKYTVRTDIMCSAERVDDDSARVDDDSARVDDNSARVDDDSARVDDDSARVDDDSARVDDNSARVDDDSARVDDDSARVDDDNA